MACWRFISSFWRDYGFLEGLWLDIANSGGY